jgi:isopenicillin-N epimerase
MKVTPSLHRASAPSKASTQAGRSWSRRTILQTLASAAALSPFSSLADSASPTPLQLPSTALRSQNPDSYWNRVRAEQFQLAEDRAFLNPGSLGVIPKSVLRQVQDSLALQAEWPTDEVPRWGYESLEPERAEMAEFLGCQRDELAFTHNCTEAISYVASGLDLKPGDEVLMTNQEHPGGYSSWKMRAARSGIQVREVEIPVNPKDPGELAQRMIDAIGPKTRVISFSGITSPTGLVLPAQDICRAARDKGIITLIDGAHMDGQIPVDVHDLGCDYFAGSPHKWMFAPAGSGLLYGRGDALNQLWPTVCNSGWDNKTGMHAARFMMIGTNNRAIVNGMIAGLRFLKSLGADAVYARQQELARHILRHVRERRYLEAVTSDDPRLFRAMVTFKFIPSELTPLWEALKSNKIYVLGGQRIRMSANIYTRKSDIDAFFRLSDRHFGK